MALLVFFIATTPALAQPNSKSSVDYSQDVAPILAKHCLACHGPDRDQREAGLRLDQQELATRRLASGRVAVLPGRPDSSELLRRVRSLDADRRMPPPDAPPLSDSEIRTLNQWIAEGAVWGRHWAFEPPRRHAPPSLGDDSWSENEIDRFILPTLNRAGMAPKPRANRRTRIRRLYLDLTGLPPSPAAIQRFLADDSPDAWERCVDRLLASPKYGQRWGRHWLDVARYGDSNGSDENHAYPHAWRYRDYVISAFNRDRSFARFAQEQIAGDILNPDSGLEQSRAEAIAATGFLAIGTKILAERDKVKMRADLVDEQVDTIGKTFLALTLGCARCHDHKFDPIPTADYYALAGVLHSTNVGDRAVWTDKLKAGKAAHEKAVQRVVAEQESLQRKLQSMGTNVVEREAETFDRGNVTIDKTNYGKEIGIISDPGGQDNFAEFDIELKQAGSYQVQLRYAAERARPGRLLVNGKVVNANAISQATGGWFPTSQRWISEGVFSFQSGRNTLRIESSPLMSHIDRIRLVRFQDGEQVAELLAESAKLDAELSKLRAAAPKPIQVMAASEGSAGDVRIHQRGSHLSLGEIAPRGFPSALASPGSLAGSQMKIGKSESGRIQLARWLTDADQGAGGQAARVIVNRVWQGHFGQGLVNTPNDFGVRGGRPSHPALFDWLALELIQHEWSLKWLHRKIVTSATYQQASTSNRFAASAYSGLAKRRLDAESLRDSMLFLSGNLDFALVGRPLSVTSQNPSPADMAKNDAAYRNFRRRSVYLPIVRSNVYRFLTLFDFPNAATPVGKRDRTTTPTQALVLLNDPFVLQQAEAIAERALNEATANGTTSGVVQSLHQRMLGRPATTYEVNAAARFLRSFSGKPGKHVGSAQAFPLPAWAAYCQVLLQSNGFFYVD